MGRAKGTNIPAAVRELAATIAGDSASHLERAAAALRLAAEADTYARAEVMAARELDAASWADVGAELGMTRQAAHERFRTGPDGYHSRWYKSRAK
jgi:hypothetical protein